MYTNTGAQQDFLKRHKSPLKHSKTIYVFTSGRVIVTVYVHGRKKDFKGVTTTTAKWTSIQERSRLSSILLQVWGGDILTSNPIATPQPKMLAYRKGALLRPFMFLVFVLYVSRHGLCSCHTRSKLVPILCLRT